MSDIKIIEGQLKELIEQRDMFNNSISILESQLKFAKIKNCEGTLIFEEESHYGNRDIYYCDTCKRMESFSVTPKDLKCKNHA